MVNFSTIDVNTFLNEYWQKKPLLIRHALPGFINPLSPDELAGLAMEDDIESRMVIHTPNKSPYWQLKHGPFLESDFTRLPKMHWTLLVQAVDKIIPEVACLLNYFDFIPQWRLDDIMISYAAKHGSVGPHYDNYDVFLYQALGERKWSLTSKNCNEANSVKGVDLRLMATFEIEEEYILSPGDMLYLPPHIGHHGISLDNDCMTYSFGYRSYKGQELWESFGDYLSENHPVTMLYQDPNWSLIKETSAIPQDAWLNAKRLMQKILDDDTLIQSWFGCFATHLDPQTEPLMPLPLEKSEWGDLSDFIYALKASRGLVRDATCRIAYIEEQLYINGCLWETCDVSFELMKKIANHRQLVLNELEPFLTKQANQLFLFDLWKLQWLGFCC